MVIGDTTNSVKKKATRKMLVDYFFFLAGLAGELELVRLP